MTFTFTIIFFVFGLIIGSFLNVVICRFNTSKSFGGRSVCLSCNEELCWYDLVPLVSFFILKGRCRHCRSRFSWQYPIVELTTATLFALLFSKLEFVFWTNVLEFSFTYAYYAVMFSVLLVIAVYDLRHKIIPDTLSLVFGILAFAGMFLFTGGVFSLHVPNVLEVLAGAALSLPFALLWLVSGGRWMGLGDAKLILGLGWFLGASLGLAALLIAFWIGAVLGVVLLALSKKYSFKSELPFAPFLVLSSFIVFFWEIKFFLLDI